MKVPFAPRNISFVGHSFAAEIHKYRAKQKVVRKTLTENRKRSLKLFCSDRGEHTELSWNQHISEVTNNIFSRTTKEGDRPCRRPTDLL